MNDSLWTFLFEIANFVTLVAVLAWLFFKPVRKALEEHRAETKRKEEAAARKLAEAEQLRQEIESRHGELATELETMRTKAREVAKQEAEEIVAKAGARIERERAALKRAALHIEQAQTAKIARAVTTATHDTMQRFLRQIEGPELEQALVNGACRELRKFANRSLAPVTVESAIPLDNESRRMIRSSLGDAANTADFRVVPELEGGLRIATAHGLIDASITGLANFAEQSLSTEMQSMFRRESEDE